MEANDFLMSGGAPAAKFPTIGTTVAGTITQQPEVQQIRDFSTGEPLYWPDGKPKMQLVVTLATDQRDPQTPDDDGRRRLYVKGLMRTAIRDAVRKAGARGLEVGGRLEVTYVADGERKGNLNPPKLYKAAYTPPQAASADDYLNGPDDPDGGSGSGGGAGNGGGAPTAPGQPDLSAMTPEQIQALLQAAQAQQSKPPF